jgi:hypothetical protein
MKRTWTIIGVRDVPHSFKWYQSLFGQPQTPPAHDYFGQILDTADRFALPSPVGRARTSHLNEGGHCVV